MLGTEVERAKKIGNISLLIWVPITLYFTFGLFTDSSIISKLVLFPLGWMGVVFLLYYRVSEQRVMEYHSNLRSEFEEGKQEVQSVEENSTQRKPTKLVCRECNQEIPTEAKRCPHCGWKPKKRGGLWWATTAAMSLNPIGWAMGAKGASDKYKASKGVSKEVPAPGHDKADETPSNSTENDPTDTLERLNELKEQGVITESEFEEKKTELLDQI